MRKSIIALLAMVLIFGITGCSGKDTSDNASDSSAGITAETEAEKSTNAIEADAGNNNSDEDTEAESDGGPSDDSSSGILSSDISSSEESSGDTTTAPTLLYQGHASTRIVTGDGKVIYVDPFMGDGYDMAADLILITHGHYDHTKTELISEKNTDCQTITWKEALVDGQHQTFDLGYVKVEAVEAGYNANHSEKECVGYILTFSNGVQLYLTGDTSTTPQMSTLADREIDYTFICCDGVYNMDTTEASECARTINSKHTIPYHMVPSSNPAGFDMNVAKKLDVSGRIILEPGDELTLE